MGGSRHHSTFLGGTQNASPRLNVARSCSPFRNRLMHSCGVSCKTNRCIRKNPRAKTRVLLIVPPYTRIEKKYTGAQVRRILGPSIDGMRLGEGAVRWIEEEGITLSEMKRVGPPMGLLRIGSAAKNAGCEVQIIDAAKEGFDNEERLLPQIGLKKYGLGNEEIMRRVQLFRPHIIGITAPYTHQWGNVRELSVSIKTANPDAVVVIGGAHATGDYRNALMDSCADFAVIGEGEKTFVELVAALEGKKRPEDVKGIAYRPNEKGKSGEPITFTGRRMFSTNPEKLFLDYSLISLEQYSGPVHTAGKRKRESGFLAYLSTSSGCNTNCGFCAIPSVQGSFVGMGGMLLGKQLAQLKGTGVTEVIVEDDNWLYNPMWALETCVLFKEHNLAWMQEGGLALYALVALHLGNRAEEVLGKEFNRASFKHIREAISKGITAEHLIREMAESGCYSVYLAIESANLLSMEISGKPRANILQGQAIEIVRIFKKHGISVTGGFMLGFCGPTEGGIYTESAEGMLKTIEYAGKLVEAGMDYANPFIVTPLPGTRMGEFQMQFVSTNYDTGFSHELGTIDLPGSLTAEQMGLLRQVMLIKANGLEKVKEILESGSWPV